MSARIGRTTRRGIAAAAVLLGCCAALAPSAFALPPVNDSFLTAALLSGATVSTTGTNVDATKETGEPNHAGYAGGKSVWYRWTAPVTGVAVIDADGSSFSTLVGAYTGVTVDGLHRVGAGWTRIRIPVTAGQEYRIAVDGDYGASGSIALKITSGAAPANDHLANAASLTGSSATATGSNVNATREPGEPSHYSSGVASVWWTWTAPSSGGATISVTGTGFNPLIGVYTGTTPSGLIRVGSGQAWSGAPGTVTFRAVEGATYKIAVDGYAYTSSNEGSISLSVDLKPPPANDHFAAAVDLGSEATALTTGNNFGASTEPGEPSHYSYYAAANSVWYSWTAPSDGSLTLTSSGSFTRALAVYTGTSVSSLTRVPLQAQNCSCQPAQIRVRVDAGVTYRIVLDGYYYGAHGTFNLSLDLIERPANDDFADAETVVGATASVTGTNVGATQEPGEPIHEENYYDPSVWYSWTAPVSGGVTLDLAGSELQGVVAIYTGDSVSALTRVPSTAAAGTTREKRYFRAALGQTYRIAVDGRRAHMGTFQLALSTRAAPVNDMFVAAVPLVADVAVSGDTLGATGENGEPGGTGGASVWYQWTAPAEGRVDLSVPTSDFGPAVSVYTGATVDALALVTSSRTFRATAGTTYRIQVHGGARPARGYFSIQLKFTAPPPNDHFADAATMSGEDASATGSNVAATREAGEPRHCCGAGRQSVWWRWTAPKDGRATLSVSGSFDWVAGVYTGSSVDALTTLGSADYGTITFMAVEGTTYSIAVDGYYSSYYYDEGSISLNMKVVDAPKNDFLLDATVLQGSSDDITGTNVNASVERYEPYHASFWPSRSVWYRWRAPATGDATIDLAGSTFDTLLSVYTGTSVGYLSRVASNDDNESSPQSRVTFNATRGTVYRIAVDGKSSATGSIALSLRHGTPPANDDFADAEQAGLLPSSTSGDSSFATKEAGEADHAGDDGGSSVWWTWTAPADGTLRASTAGTGFDTVLGVYTGDAVDALEQVAANDDAAADDQTSEVDVAVVEGTTYAIAVDGANDREGPAQGPITLDLGFTPTVSALTAAAGTGDGDGDGGDTGRDTGETGDTTGDTGDTTGGTGDTTGGTGDTTGETGDTTGETGETGETGDTTGDTGDDTGDTGTGDDTGTTDTSDTGDTGSRDGGETQSESVGDSAQNNNEQSARALLPPSAPAPPTAPGAPAPQPRQTPAAPLTVSLAVRAQRIRTVMRRGLVGTASCSAACRIDVAVVMPAGAVAAKARMAAAKRSAATVAGAGSRGKFAVKLSRAARKALRKAKRSLTVELVVVATQGSQTATAKRRVTLRR